MSEFTALRAQLKADRKTYLRDEAGIYTKAERENRNVTAVEEAAAVKAHQEADRVTARLSGIPKVPKEHASPKRPGPHSERGTHSYFGDLYTVGTKGMASSEGQQAAKRLEQTAKENRGYFGRKSETSERQLSRRGVMAMNADGNRVSSRDGSTALGDAGEFTPPIYLVDHWASIARSCAPLIATCDAVPLPDGCMSIFVPQFETFTNTTYENQNIENVGPVVGPANPTTDALSSPVGTVASSLTVSQQILDRTPGPGLDRILLQEAAEGYAAYVESQLFIGDGIGAGGVYPGIYNTAGIFQQVYTSASPTVTGVVENISQAAAQVGNNRLRKAEAVFCSPARLEWLFGNPDTTSNSPRPLIGTGLVDGSDETTRCYGPIGTLPAYASGVLNFTGTADIAFVGRPKDLLLLQGVPKFEFQNEGMVAGQISALFRARTYVANVVRYPSGWASVYGTGFIRGTGW